MRLDTWPDRPQQIGDRLAVQSFLTQPDNRGPRCIGDCKNRMEIGVERHARAVFAPGVIQNFPVARPAHSTIRYVHHVPFGRAQLRSGCAWQALIEDKSDQAASSEIT